MIINNLYDLSISILFSLWTIWIFILLFCFLINKDDGIAIAFIIITIVLFISVRNIDNRSNIIINDIIMDCLIKYSNNEFNNTFKSIYLTKDEIYYIYGIALRRYNFIIDNITMINNKHDFPIYNIKWNNNQYYNKR